MRFYFSFLNIASILFWFVTTLTICANESPRIVNLTADTIRVFISAFYKLLKLEKIYSRKLLNMLDKFQVYIKLHTTHLKLKIHFSSLNMFHFYNLCIIFNKELQPELQLVMKQRMFYFYHSKRNLYCKKYKWIILLYLNKLNNLGPIYCTLNDLYIIKIL